MSGHELHIRRASASSEALAHVACYRPVGDIGVFSMFDGLAEGDVRRDGQGVLILSVIVLSLLHKRQGFRRAVDPALESLGRKCSAVTMVAMSIGIPLTGIYLLVRFIRWAWTDRVLFQSNDHLHARSSCAAVEREKGRGTHADAMAGSVAAADTTGGVQSCSYATYPGRAGWDVMLLENGEPLFSRRCAVEFPGFSGDSFGAACEPLRIAPG